MEQTTINKPSKYQKKIMKISN